MGYSNNQPHSILVLYSVKDSIYPRHIELRLRDALADSPVVLIQGPRQCGKTTLAQTIGESEGYKYFTFDDEGTYSYAAEDPVGFINSLPERAILDEAQLAPGLFPSIKLSVDNDRVAGRFILTGSVNLLQMTRIKESLAGRMDIVRLHPFSQNELEQTTLVFLDYLFSADESSGDILEFRMREPGPAGETEQEDYVYTRKGALVFDHWRPKNVIERVVAGGYPTALRRTPARRANWYQTYIEALIERDASIITEIHSLETLPRLLELAAAQTARLLSVNGLASSFQLNRLTIQSYLTLLEKMFLLERIPAWHSNHLKRLVKTPKIHLCDTGVICALLNLNAASLSENRSLFGHILETFVLQELKRQASAHHQRHTFHHFRDRYGSEVDIVIQRGALAVAGVEVKASGTVVNSDFKGLRKLQEAAGRKFAGGLLLYNGDRVSSFGDKLYAVPLQFLWTQT